MWRIPVSLIRTHCKGWPIWSTSGGVELWNYAKHFPFRRSWQPIGSLSNSWTSPCLCWRNLEPPLYMYFTSDRVLHHPRRWGNWRRRRGQKRRGNEKGGRYERRGQERKRLEEIEERRGGRRGALCENAVWWTFHYVKWMKTFLSHPKATDARSADTHINWRHPL